MDSTPPFLGLICVSSNYYGIYPFFFEQLQRDHRRRKSLSLQKRGGSIFLDPIRGFIQLPIDVLQRAELIVQRGD